MNNTNIINLIEEFYCNPNYINEKKINIIKNYFYNDVKDILKINKKNLLIGMKKNKKNFIYFKSKTNNLFYLELNYTLDFKQYNLIFNDTNKYSIKKNKKQSFCTII